MLQSYAGRISVLLCSVVLSMAVAASVVCAAQVDVITIDDPITPVVAEYIIKSIAEAEAADAACLVIMMDTPGGLDLSMRKIIKSIHGSAVPVAVYVGPTGARAASAGAIITIAAHVAAMAPGTNIGAAHPVNLGGGDMGKEMAAKVENDAAAYVESIAEKMGRNKEWAVQAVRESVSISETEALREKVIDLVAADLTALLESIDGRSVETVRGPVTLATAGAQVNRKKMGFRENILKALANPNIAYILMMIGMAGLYFELSNPGAIFPGAVGGLSLILAFYSMQTLSANYAGVLLIMLGGVLFIIELKVTSYGLLSLGGIIAMTLGSLMLFDSPLPYMRLSLGVIISTVACVSLFFIFVVGLVVKAQSRRPATGNEGLVGLEGVAHTPIDTRQGKVFVHGEYWNAVCAGTIEPGDPVRVESVNGMLLTVVGKK